MIRVLSFIALTLTASLPARAEVAIQEVISPGGITAWLVEEHSIPFTALEIRFKGGASLDDPAKRGAINLMTGLIEEGAGDLDARGFAKARDALAASYGFDVHDDSLSISAKFLTENRDEAIELLRSAIIDTRFDQDALDRVRQQVLAGLRSDAKDPNEIAGPTFDQISFGDHPYGSSIDGTADTVAALTQEDLFQAHRDALVRDRVYVGAAGDITADELGALIDDLLGDLPFFEDSLSDLVDPTAVLQNLLGGLGGFGDLDDLRARIGDVAALADAVLTECLPDPSGRQEAR